MTETFPLPAGFTIDVCPSVHAALTALVGVTDAGGMLTLDAAPVERLTTPGIQLLCALDKSLAAKQAALKIVGAGERFIDTCKILGLKDHLQRWSEPT